MLRSFAAGGRCVCGGCRRQDQQHLLLRAQLDAVAQAAVGQDSRFGAAASSAFTGEIDPRWRTSLTTAAIAICGSTSLSEEYRESRARHVRPSSCWPELSRDPARLNPSLVSRGGLPDCDSFESKKPSAALAESPRRGTPPEHGSAFGPNQRRSDCMRRPTLRSRASDPGIADSEAPCSRANSGGDHRGVSGVQNQDVREALRYASWLASGRTIEIPSAA